MIAVLLGLMAIIAGIMFQASGAPGAVYCSVIGGGIILFVVGAVIWSVRMFGGRKHRKPTTVGV